LGNRNRPWRGTGPPAVVYSYAPGRGGEHLEKLLANYRGIVQCDGYAPYKKLPADRITVAFCWSHLRREFFKIAERGDAPIATEAVARIAQIYAIEKDGMRSSPVMMTAPKIGPSSASLIEKAKLSGIDPQPWLADILARLVNLWPNNRLDEFLPWTWTAAHKQQQRAA
jgi:hypothetical protein